MMDQIYDSDDAALCKQILAIASTVYRPITVAELTSLADMLEDVADDPESLEEIVALCGSFLTLRDHAIYFVHQSAKEFLRSKAYHQIFPSGIEHIHYTIFSRSLTVMSNTLRRDIYDLRHPGFLIDEVKPPEPDPLAKARYSCVYWIDHLHDCNPTGNTAHDVRDGGSVDKFLRSSYLHWLEALSLLGSMSEGILSMVKLDALLQVRRQRQRRMICSKSV